MLTAGLLGGWRRQHNDIMYVSVDIHTQDSELHDRDLGMVLLYVCTTTCAFQYFILTWRVNRLEDWKGDTLLSFVSPTIWQSPLGQLYITTPDNPPGFCIPWFNVCGQTVRDNPR